MKVCELNIKQVETWYQYELKTTFIEQERKPLEVIIELIQQDKYKVLGFFEQNIVDEVFNETNMVGYATFAKNKNINLILLDYLGVTEKFRNKGLGGKILNHAKDYFKETAIVLESELPKFGESIEENSIRERRIKFYIRNGFVPVYEMATCGLRWIALIGGTMEVPVNIERVMQDHKALYDEYRNDVVIPLAKEDEPPKSCWHK